MNIQPADYLSALYIAWEELVEWVDDGRFVPENEESIQCFLYRGIVNNLNMTSGVRSKPTTAKPRKVFDREKKYVPGMHFPDFILGDPKQVVVEIKYARGSASIYGACKVDVNKMKQRHGDDSVRRVFILFDENPDCVFINQKQKDELQALDPTCTLLHYPRNLNPHGSAAKKAWAKIHAKSHAKSHAE